MRYLLVICLYLIITQNESKIVRNRRISDRRSDDSLNINVSAGYGVETENALNLDLLKISKPEQNVTDSQKISTVYAIQVEPTPTSNSELKITKTVPDNNQQSSEIYVLQSSQNEQTNQPNPIPDNPNQTPILPEKVYDLRPQEVHFRPVYEGNDIPYSEALVSQENNNIESTPVAESTYQYRSSEQNLNSDKSEPFYTNYNTQESFQPSPTDDNNYLRNHSPEYRPQEDVFQSQQNEPQYEQYFERPTPTSTYQVQENFEDSHKVRPSLGQLQNLITKLEDPNKQPAATKVVQVLKVPAVYEIHVQSDGMPALGRDMIMFRDHSNYLSESTEVHNKYQNGPLTFNNNPYMENHHPKYITKPQLLRAHSLNRMRNQYNNKYLKSMSKNVNKYVRPSSMDYYYFKDNTIDRPSQSYSQVTIKQQYNQPSTENLPVPLKLTAEQPVKYATATLPAPQSTVESLPVPLKLSASPQLKYPAPTSGTKQENFNFDFNYIEDYRKPQALHIVPAPVLTGTNKTPQLPSVRPTEARPSAFNSHQQQPYAFVKPVEESKEAISYQNINYHTTPMPNDLVYGKQKENVAAPQVYERPTQASYQAKRPRYYRKPVQNYAETSNFESMRYTTSRPKNYRKYPANSRSNEMINTPLSLFYMDPKKIKKSSDVEPYYVDRNEFNDIMETSENGEQMMDSTDEDVQEENVDNYAVNEYNEENMNQNFYNKYNKRQSKKSNLMDYIVYITEKTFDDD